MTVMSTLVGSLQRELAIPGTFADVFPDTTTKDLAATLADAYAEAKLDAFFGDVTLDTTDPIALNWFTTPDLSEAGGALVVIYASMRVIRAQLRVMASSETYKAGSVEYSTSRPSNLLREELLFLKQRQADIIAAGQRTARTCSAAVFDGYLARLDHCGGHVDLRTGFGGFFPYEYRG